MRAVCVCSDAKASRKMKDADDEDASVIDLAVPATTNTQSILRQLRQYDKEACRTVIFSTYQSIDVVKEAIDLYGREADLIICDEAHRTTGVVLKDKAESNLKYPHLDKRIAETYAANTNATNKNSLYDSYIRAFRWASDRIAQCPDGGIVAFISNGSWIDGNAQDGMRKCLSEEFDKIFVYNMRGNARTSGELRRKESGNVFGEGTRTPIAITILVKKGKKNG